MSVRLSAPFGIEDYNKCELLNEKLKAHGLTMQKVVYNTARGNYIDTSPTKSIRDSQIKSRMYGDSRDKMPGSCHIQGSDKDMQVALFEKGKLGGAEATAFAIFLEKNRVDNTDIPVNLASCNGSKGTRTSEVFVLKDMPSSCQIERIHAHNTNDINAAFHIHIRCNDTSEKTLSFLSNLVRNANSAGKEMCMAGKARTRMVSSRAMRLNSCIEGCLKSRSKQTRFDVMGGF